VPENPGQSADNMTRRCVRPLAASVPGPRQVENRMISAEVDEAMTASQAFTKGVREPRKEPGRTQRILAQTIRHDFRYLSRIETGR
jgi:hypothetical protein